MKINKEELLNKSLTQKDKQLYDFLAQLNAKLFATFTETYITKPNDYQFSQLDLDKVFSDKLNDYITELKAHNTPFLNFDNTEELNKALTEITDLMINHGLIEENKTDLYFLGQSNNVYQIYRFNTEEYIYGIIAIQELGAKDVFGFEALPLTVSTFFTYLNNLRLYLALKNKAFAPYVSQLKKLELDRFEYFLFLFKENNV